MSSNKLKPTESEIEILQILWEHGPQNVRFINDKLNEHREVGYTSTLKIMQLMLEKGFLDRDASSRTHIYKAKVNEQKIQGQLLKKFVNTAFRGSAMKMVMSALGNHNPSAEELDEIKDLIKKIEKK